MRIGVVGGGISGLVAAWALDADHEVVLLEADRRLGGHTNTVTAEVEGVEHRVDTGFIVYNEPNYPAFTRMLATLGVASIPSEMSFSVADEAIGIEWRGSSLPTVFAQARNLGRPAFLRMLADVVSFHRALRRIAAGPDGDPGPSLADVLAGGRWSPRLLDWYVVPLGSAIWSADPATFTAMPARTFAGFLDNHGLLRLGGRPPWRTVAGGAATYVEAVRSRLRGRVVSGAAVRKVARRPGGGVEVWSEATGPLELDHVVLACHAPEALDVLADPTPVEREVLGALRFQPNSATLHTDGRLLPTAPRARAAWNYFRPAAARPEVMVTYDMNLLQGIRSARPLLVTLNRDDAVDPAQVLARFCYDHPVLDAAAVAAQARHGEVSGVDGVSYAGAYWGHGFHEDGVQSALRACAALGVRAPWERS